MNSGNFEEQIREIVAGLRAEEQEVQVKLERIRNDRRSAERVLALYRERRGISTDHEPFPGLNKLEGTTLTDKRKNAFIAIAPSFPDQIVDISQVGITMVEAGLYRDLKQFRHQAYDIVGTMSCFGKVSPGKYRYIPDDRHVYPTDLESDASDNPTPDTSHSPLHLFAT